MVAEGSAKSTDIIRELLDHAAIRQVICVDDEYSTSPALEEVIALCAMCPAEDVKRILEADSSIDDPDMREQHIRQLWSSGISENQKRTLYRRLKDVSPDNDKGDSRAASVLHELIGDGLLTEMSYQQWLQDKDGVLTSKRNGKVLLLFDQNMANDGGAEDSGVQLIGEVLRRTRSRFVCGLLSRTLSSSDESKAWNSMSAQYGLDKDRFIPISKERLQGQRDHIGFANGIRRVVLNPQLKQLKRTVSIVIGKAQKEAIRAIEQLDILDLEQIVVRSSNEEGVWEPDTLFRLFGVYHRASARKKYLADPNLHQLAAKVRSLGAAAAVNDSPLNDTVWLVQNLELYEDGGLINQSHLPIELGDIFEKTTSGRRFILVAQPCDLMVRGQGTRRPSVNEGVLAEIRKDPDRVNVDSLAALEFYESREHSWFVDLGKTYTVALSVLDLCSYQEDGTACMVTTSRCPECVIPSWQKHYDKLSRYFESLVSKYDALKALGLDKQEIERGILRSSADGLFKGKVDSQRKTISYDCKRIGRICRPHAEALLTKYAHHITRAAFEHYFDKGVAN